MHLYQILINNPHQYWFCFFDPRQNHVPDDTQKLGNFDDKTWKNEAKRNYSVLNFFKTVSISASGV